MSKVLVAGRIDTDAVINVSRHPRPGEEIAGWGLEYLPGGKGANQAVAAARAGADVTMLGCVGADSFGRDLLEFLTREQVDVAHVTSSPGFRTGVAFIVVDEAGENTIVYDGTQMPPFTFDDTIGISVGDVLVSQFDIPESAIIGFLAAGRDNGARTVFNAAPAQPISAELLRRVDILVLNEFELARVAGTAALDPTDRYGVEAAMHRFDAPGVQALVVTLGAAGVVARAGKQLSWFEATKDVAVDTTGAGDAFTGALAAELCRGSSLGTAITYACVSAGISVTRRGAALSMPHRHEVLPRLPHVSGGSELVS
ncbi:ribokinase [Streptomyces sp. NPDC047000]|uniref:ribokinase n=1 Tax=Streptomyces sp. NPDC047000 TaxID=3155474 RepID=UPI0033C3EC9B